MKLSTAMAALLAVPLMTSTGHASQNGSDLRVFSAAETQTAQLYWRCGRNNPAEWGTFGNGCLKQKRAAKKKSSSDAQDTLTG